MGATPDTYVLNYYNEQDVACSKTVETRRANFSRRIGDWSQMVSDVVTEVLAQGPTLSQASASIKHDGGAQDPVVAKFDPRGTK